MSIDNIEKMVDDIRTKRTSKMDDSQPIRSPFIIVKHDENRSVVATVSHKALKTNFILDAIINDKAFIDGAWRQAGDSVGDFEVASVASDHVVLKRKNRTITLYFRATKNILKITKE
jgi:hypothetical protein